MSDRENSIAKELLPLIPGHHYRLRNGQIARIDKLQIFMGETLLEGKVLKLTQDLTDQFFLWTETGRHTTTPDHPEWDIVDNLTANPIA
jgi:hypothetical protein